MAKKRILIGGNTKSLAPWDVDDNQFWESLNANNTEMDIGVLSRRVPWLYRGVKDRANNVSHMPWVIEQGENEIANSDEWAEDKPVALEFISNPRKLLSQIEQSLAIAGKAYCSLDVTAFNTPKAINYLNPDTIDEVYDKKTGELTGYTRLINNQRVPCSRADEKPVSGQVQLVAFYDPDYATEVGPGKVSDGLAALTAAGVLYSYDIFVTNYFDRGAIKASILTVDGASQGEQERLTKWWGDVAKGVRDSWSSFVFRGKAVAPVVIGEGMEGIKDNDLSTQRRQDICTAMGVPESRLWSAAANMATRHEDEVAYFRGTIMPECDIIQETLNEQVFNALHKLDGYRWEFQPEKLDVFKEDDTERATRLKVLVDAGTPLLTAYDLVEWELTDEQRAELEPKPEPEPVIVAPVAPVDDTQPETIPPMGNQDMQASVRAMLKNWERKALYILKTKGKINMGWETDLLPLEQVQEIRAQLTNCVSSNDVKSVFYEVVIPDAFEDPLIILARELKLAREALA